MGVLVMFPLKVRIGMIVVVFWMLWSFCVDALAIACYVLRHRTGPHCEPFTVYGVAIHRDERRTTISPR
jgi:hypothetical protein